MLISLYSYAQFMASFLIFLTHTFVVVVVVVVVLVGLRSGPCAYKASTLPLDPHLHYIFALVIWK
jgi:hypothetical protein